MDATDVLAGAFAMPRCAPSYVPGPHRFTDREFLTIGYRSEPGAIAALLPEPLRPMGAEVRLQFAHMPDGTGFGAYAMVAQCLPCLLPDGSAGQYMLGGYVNSHTAISGGRELWGFPQKLAQPALRVERDTLLGTLDMGPVAVARASMGYKHAPMLPHEAHAAIGGSTVVLKIIPHVDGRPRILELVRCRLDEIRLKGAWRGPAALALHAHALAPLADLPVLEVLGASHVIADCTLAPGEVLHDYLAEEMRA